MSEPNELSALLAQIEAALRKHGHPDMADFFRRAQQLNAAAGPAALAEARDIEGFASDLDDHGHHRFALPLYESCQPVFERFAPPAEYGRFLMHRAIVFRKLGAHAEAVSAYDQALPLLQQYAPPADHARCLVNRAAALWAQGKCEDAMVGYDQALPLLQQYALLADYSRCSMNRALAFQDLGQHAEAMAEYERALPLLQKHASPTDYARCLMHRANTLQRRREHSEAVGGYDQALPLLQKHAPPADYARCLMNRANSLRDLGRHAEAIAGYDQALPLLQQYAPPTDYALCLMNRANSLRRQRRHPEAVAGYDQALPLLHQHALPADHALCLMSRANAFREQGQHAEAVAGYNQVLPLLQRYALPADYARCLVNRASAHADQKSYAEAVADYDKALPILRDQAPPADYANCLMNRATALADQGHLAEAVAGYEQALPILQQHAPPADYANCLMNRAFTLVMQGRYTDAVGGYDLARRVLRSARRHAGADDTGLEFHHSYAKLFHNAVRAGLEGNLPDGAYDAARDGKAGVVDDLAFKLQRTCTPEPPAVGLARAKLTDWLRNNTAPQPPAGNLPTEHEIEAFGREIETYLRTREELTHGYLSEWGQHAHAYDPARAAVPVAEDPPTRAEIQALLPERWALIDFWGTSNNEFHAFVLTRDEFRVEKLPFPVEQLAPRLAQTAEDVRRVGWREPQLGGLNDLGERLFVPLLPLLRKWGIEGLYLVPHEFLHLFPLHAAVTGQHTDGRPKYLCDEFAVAYLPSANMLPWLPKPDPTGRPFVLANPEHGTPHSLPFAHWEGQQLRTRLAVPPDRYFLGAKGTFAATEKWAGCGFVHFSCHGSADDRFAPRSHLRLADDLLLGHDVLHRRPELRKGAVVVLNGCQTSAPDWRAVNEGMGLMTPFLLRGAGVVFGTQWSVLDMCAADMVLTFAQAVRAPGGSPAAALKAAQSQLRRTSPLDMLARLDGVAEQFPVGSVEQGKVLEQRAWLSLRLGRYADARTTAARCAAPLRDAGRRAEADELAETVERAEKEGLPDWFRRVQFDNPVFWAAFQLVGRVA